MPDSPPWGLDPTFEWDFHNETHIARHAVYAADVEECFDGPYRFQPHKKAAEDPLYADRYIVFGESLMQRKLIIIVRHKGGSLLRPITAFEPKEGDRGNG